MSIDAHHKNSGLQITFRRVRNRGRRIVYDALSPPSTAGCHPDYVLLAENLTTLFEKAGKILETPEFRFTPLEIAYFYRAIPFFGALKHLPLGALLQGWRDGDLLDDCSNCQQPGSLHLVSLTYSFAGSTHTGICRDCLRWREHRNYPASCRYPSAANVHQRISTVMERLAEEFRNEPLVVKGIPSRFDWESGIVMGTPDLMIRPAVEPLSLSEVVDLIRPRS